MAEIKKQCECLDLVRRLLIDDAKFLAEKGFRRTAVALIDDAAKMDDKSQSLECFDLRELRSRRETLETWKKLIEAGAKF